MLIEDWAQKGTLGGCRNAVGQPEINPCKKANKPNKAAKPATQKNEEKMDASQFIRSVSGVGSWDPIPDETGAPGM
jgi:hypothetical protein